MQKEVGEGIVEKRKSLRESVAEEISFSHFNEDGSLNLEGKGMSVNLSPMGIQIRVDKELPINTKILIELLFPKEIQKYTGEIAWVDEVGEGIFAIGIRILFKKVIYR